MGMRVDICTSIRSPSLTCIHGPAGYRGSAAQAVGRRIIMIKNKFGIRAGEVRTIIGENKTGQDHYKMVVYTILLLYYNLLYFYHMSTLIDQHFNRVDLLIIYRCFLDIGWG